MGDRGEFPAPEGGIEHAALGCLPDYLIRQRWYPAKDAGPPAVELALSIPFMAKDFAATIAVWTVTPPGRPAFRIFLPLAAFPAGLLDVGDRAAIASLPESGLVLGDAFASDAFVRAWVGVMLGRQTDPRLHGGRTSRIEDADLEGADWPIARGDAEQSNTSIRIGGGAILKVIRKLEEGVHPELEMGRFLTEQARFAATPALLGWVDLDGATVSVLQAFVRNDGDGWSWIVERLRAGTPAAEREVTRWLEQLGRRTAELHRAFAAADDPAFRPEPVTQDDLQRWAQDARRMAHRAGTALAGLGQRDPSSGLAQAVAGRLPGLFADPPPVPAGCVKTRLHGDYHLGQVLVHDGDAIIVDFEGEPLRPLSARREKSSPLRDVAGMLRSFAYAVAAAGGGQGADSRARDWLPRAARAFLNAYLATIRGSPACPRGKAETRRLIRFFMLEKALYEVVYECAHRPDWVSVPLRGVLALLDDPASQGVRQIQDRPIVRAHRMEFGAEIGSAGAVRFRLWAPSCQSVQLALRNGPVLPMQPAGNGWFELITAEARAGTCYHFVLPDGMRVPDPASRFQPEDAHGPSEVIDPTGYAWRDASWRGRPWRETVLYELHIGTFTPDGTFSAAIQRLDHLAALGVTAIEIMPVADFPGRCNWGYDGVLPFAPDSTYGRPEDLKALVDAAHARGIMVLLDVVYNHFGPDGNYLPVYAPAIFTDRHKTPWGSAVNYDGEGSSAVREFVIQNALYWIGEYHLDGLRLDAVHAIIDDSPQHILQELAARVHRHVAGRHVHLVLENEKNEASLLARDATGAPRCYTAQWNDDVHHVLHVAATGEDQGYYAEYRGDAGRLGRALAEGFAFQGEMMGYRGETRGEPSAHLPPTAFVAFIQNHDQIGNRAFGERIGALAAPEAVRAIAATYLLLPQIPMLFMGEEWSAAQPFPFFCDFSGELADAVREGRRQEFARFPQFRDPELRARIPDPQAEATFASAKLDWSALAREPHAGTLAWYRRILAVRRERLVPLLRGAVAGGQYSAWGAGQVSVAWRLEQGAQLALAANLSAESADGFPSCSGTVLWQEGAADNDGSFGPWSVRWSLDAPS